MLVEDGQPSSHNHTYEEKGETEQVGEAGEETSEDETDLLPPPVTQLGDGRQKRSSGRATTPSSRLRGYELYEPSS